MQRGLVSDEVACTLQANMLAEIPSCQLDGESKSDSALDVSAAGSFALSAQWGRNFMQAISIW